MDIFLDAKKTSRSELEESKVHSLPCHIQYDGKAKVDAYFIVQPHSVPGDSTPAYTATFRGYPLYAKDVTLPSTYTGTLF
jgi:hypothetical protein